MATWQADFRLILDGLELPDDFRTRLDEVLPRGRSWSSEIEQWGASDSDVIEVSVEPGEPPELFCRFDLRAWKPELYRRFIECARAIGARLVTADDEAIELHVQAFEGALGRSRAARFVADPHAYLETLAPMEETDETARRARHLDRRKRPEPPVNPRAVRRAFLNGLLAGVRVVWPILSGLLAVIAGLGLVIGLMEDWSVQESIYFAFVSGLTIGYGDFAPRRLVPRVLAIVIGICGVLVTALVAAVAVKALTALDPNGDGQNDV